MFLNGVNPVAVYQKEQTLKFLINFFGIGSSQDFGDGDGIVA